jgi:hypothetical protein
MRIESEVGVTAALQIHSKGNLLERHMAETRLPMPRSMHRKCRENVGVGTRHFPDMGPPSIERLTVAGAVPNTTLVLVTELFCDWKSPLADPAREVIKWYMPEAKKLVSTR